MPNYRVRLMSNKQGGFYETVGPVLSRREIVDELGHPMWDDDGKVWSVAISGGVLVGCVAIKGDHVCSLYVAPDRRRQGMATDLIRRALTTAPLGVAYKAVATAASVPAFTANGFELAGERGRYTLLARPC